jgi:hypothetical protein
MEHTTLTFKIKPTKIQMTRTQEETQMKRKILSSLSLTIAKQASIPLSTGLVTRAT